MTMPRPADAQSPELPRSSVALKCLFVSPFLPYPPEDGGRIRIYELLRNLAERQHVEVLTFVDPRSDSEERIEQLVALGLTVHAVPHPSVRTLVAAARAATHRRSLYASIYESDALGDRLRSLVRSNAYDIVQCEFAYMAQYAPQRRVHSRPRWVFDAHNVESQLSHSIAESGTSLAYRLYARREARLRRAEELEYARRVDRVVVVSANDRDALVQQLPTLDVDVVPNGVDVDRFAPSDAPEPGRRPSAVFVGKMDYRPNVDAVRWFCSEILPRVRMSEPRFGLTICGSEPTRAVMELAKLPGVSVTGRVPDVRPYVDEAALVVVPLRAGSGTRLKILEALALGRAVVSTSIGAQGLDVVPGEHLELADDPGAFSEAVLRLIGDPAWRERLGRSGRRLVVERYAWSALASRLEAIHHELLESETVLT